MQLTIAHCLTLYNETRGPIECSRTLYSIIRIYRQTMHGRVRHAQCDE